VKKIVLADARNGAIVRVDGDWGVVCKGHYRASPENKRIVDFWDIGRVYVEKWKIVEVQA
jgi:hypothetical protein